MQSAIESSIAISRKVWTRQEAQALVAMGFPNAEKLELIEGDLIDRMGKGHLHMLWQNLIHRWLVNVFGWDFVRSEGSTEVDEHNAPEPDLMVTQRSIRDCSRIPVPGDVTLVVEISDSILQFDMKVKADLYARAAIADYWVVDVQDKRLFVHRAPSDGAYTRVQTYASNDEVEPLSAPGAKFSLDRL